MAMALNLNLQISNFVNIPFYIYPYYQAKNGILFVVFLFLFSFLFTFYSERDANENIKTSKYNQIFKKTVSIFAKCRKKRQN